MVMRHKVEKILLVYARGGLSPRSDSTVNSGSIVGDSIWDVVRLEAKCEVLPLGLGLLPTYEVKFFCL
ncbi:hypothetical protein L1987_54626 [Smallanthus sonchifolius]|uniref:Uncharacterized protein n=1 Tax=Smallanthus sonchifolius TaxID=185202 RepID=A0ACB9E846_9ASTR|nr:hypothetical protein L1987_54626 [Smallanthus sonchifolius]